MVKHVFRYLHGTEKVGITFTGEGGLMGMVDADWNGNLDDRTSSTGYIFFFAGGPVAWKSQWQSLPAQSSSEAELVAVNEAVWLRKLLSELGCDFLDPTTIWEDNQSCIRLSKDPEAF